MRGRYTSAPPYT